jgi:hypothetical protein
VIEAPSKPTVLLGARVSSDFIDRLATRCTVLGPLPPPFPKRSPRCRRPTRSECGR